MQSDGPPTNTALDADTIRRAEKLLADRRRSPRATVADLCALFDELARVKRERDEAEAWWRAVLVSCEQPSGTPGRTRGDYDGPTVHTLADVRREILHVQCEKCGRTDAHSLADLLNRYGPTAILPGVLIALSLDCARRQADRYQDRCGLEWTDMDALASARSDMIATLNSFRDTLEDLGGGLGVTDPVSGSVVLALK